MSKLINEISEWFGVAEYSEVMERLENGTSPVSFTGEIGKTLNDDKFGRISIKDFFEGNNGSGVFNGEILTIEEIKELENELGDFTEKDSDYTYNFGSSLERDINYKVYENEEDETVIVFYSIHIGLDARWGFSKSIAVKYENEYDYKEDLYQTFNIAYATFTINNKEYSISVYGYPMSEGYQVYISDNQNNEYSNSYDNEGYGLDLYDKEDFKDSLIEYFKENKISFDENSIKIID